MPSLSDLGQVYQNPQPEQTMLQKLGTMMPTGAAFGTGSPAEMSQQPAGLSDFLGGAYNYLGGLAKRSFESAGRFGQTGEYDPAPIVEAAGLMFGGGMPMAEKGAAGIFGGKLAATADHAALAKAEQMASNGAPREAIHAETGWFKGPDGKWRFEIDDSKSAISPAVAGEFEKRSVGDQVPVQNADRFMNHPDLFAAYPDLWRVNTRLEKGGGYPYQPSGNYSVRESGAEGIGLNADTLGRARSLNLHELQHAIQQREGFAPGADAKAVGLDAYYKSPGEIEAYNVQRRLFMTPAERKATPPWLTE